MYRPPHDGVHLYPQSGLAPHASFFRSTVVTAMDHMHLVNLAFSLQSYQDVGEVPNPFRMVLATKSLQRNHAAVAFRVWFSLTPLLGKRNLWRGGPTHSFLISLNLEFNNYLPRPLPPTKKTRTHTHTRKQVRICFLLASKK